MRIRRSVVVTCALVIALACTTGVAHAAQVHVSVEGSDTAGNGSAAAPYATIQHGIDEAAFGDDVVVGPGTFTECVTMSEGVSLFGAGSDQTIIDADEAGSVISAEDMDAPQTIEGFTLINGVAAQGGGIRLDNASPLIRHNLIARNRATEFGGGIYVLNSSPVIDGNTIRENDSSNESFTEGWGGGIYSGAVSRPTISNNVIVGNSTFGNGGGIDCNDSSPLVFNNVISGNYAHYYGGGIECGTTRLIAVTIMNNTVVDNTSDFAQAGGIEYDGNGLAPIVFNTIVWGNHGGQLWRIDPTHSCIEGGAAGEGNIDGAPSFVATDTGNYALDPDSPCINAGQNSGAPATDIRGIPRPQMRNVDIGAYEFCFRTMPTETCLTVNAKSKAGRTFRVRGTVYPAVATGQVRVYREFRSDGHWVKKGSSVVRLEDGTFACGYSTRAKGSWRFKAMYLGGEMPDVTTFLRSGSSWQRTFVY